MVAMELSGSSGRSFLLLVTNLVLLVLGAIMIAAGSIIRSIFLLHLLTFASQLFNVTPILLIVSGTLTILVAIFGLSLFKRKTEGSNSFMAYAGIIFVAMCLSISACVTSFVLREAIAHRFSKTNVRGELLAYSIDPVVRNRWDMLQYEYSCCGGYNAGTGYTDWEGVQTDPQPADGAAFAPLLSPESDGDNSKQLVPTLTAVPDSCCLKVQPGCGKAAFTDDISGATVRDSSLSEKIHVNGCMTVVWLALYKHVMPTLMICALVALVVALIELLLLLSACCFADHIRKIQRDESEKSSSEKEGIIDSHEEAYSIHHEEKYHEYSLQDGRPSRGSFYDQDEGNNSLGSWYADSSSDGAAPAAVVGARPSGPQQLQSMEQSPSLRKNRFFFQSSDGVNENGIANITEIEGHLESGKSLLGEGRTRIPSGSESARAIGNGVGATKGGSGVGRLFTKFLPSNLSTSRKGPNKDDNFEQGRKEALMEEALVREKTLMDVLKSVTRSKSRENVIEDSVNMNVRLENSDGQNVELGDANNTVKKLPTIGRTIDRSRKYRPMENLSEAPVKKKSGLDRLRKMKNDMFGGRKESKDATEMTIEKLEAGSIQFQLQKGEPDRNPDGHEMVQTSSIDGQIREPIVRGQLAVEVERERKESESAARERRESRSGSRERERHASGTGSTVGIASGTLRERHNSGSGTLRERHNSGSIILRERRDSESRDISPQKMGHVRRPSDGSGIPQLVRENSLESQPKSILSPKSSLSDSTGNPPSRNVSARFHLPPSEEPEDQSASASTQTSRTPERPVRVSGFGVTENSLAAKQKSAIRRSTRNLSLTSNPKLNTIHEPSETLSSPNDETGSKVRTRSVAAEGGDVEDPRSNAKVSQRTSIASGPGGLYYFDGSKWRQGDLSGQMIVRSDDHLNRLINQPVGAQLASSLSTDSVHVTRIKVEKENEEGRKVQKKDDRKKEKEKDKKKDKKRKEKEKEKEKSKKRKTDSSKTRRKSVSESDSSDTSDSSSDSDSDDSVSDSSESTSSSSSSSSDGRSSKKTKSRDSLSKKDKKSRSKDKEKKEKKKSKKSKRSRSRSASPDKKDKSKKGRKTSNDHEDKEDHKKSRRRTSSKSESHENAKDGNTLEAGTSQGQPLYDNVDVVRLVSPPPSWAKVQLVPGSNQPQSDFFLAQATGDEGQEVAYYTTATLPSGASLRRAGFNVHDGPRLVAVSERGKSEPRIIVAPNDRGATLDRYTMTGRSKSQERIPVKLRRQTVHQDTMQYLKVSPPTGQGVTTVAAASSALPGSGRTRSMSMTAEAPEVWEVIQHQQNNPHLYRTSVEYDSLGEAYTVHQSSSGRPVHSIGYKNESRKMTAPLMEPQHIWSRDQSRHHHHHHTAEAKLVIHPSEELLYQQQQQRQHQPGYR